jgi:PAS domain S-box-containing protein
LANQQSSAGTTAGVAEAVSVLIVEDSADDAELVLRELLVGGFHPTAERVYDAESMRRALQAGSYDVVISDYAMPRFSAPRALEIAKEHDPDLPFVAISGTVGEETAVELMRAGADNYVMKDRLARLAPAVRLALDRAAERRALREAQEALRRSHEELEQRVRERTADLERANADLSAHREEMRAASEELAAQHEELRVTALALDAERRRYRDLFESAPVAYVVTDAEGTIVEANGAALELLGTARVGIEGRRLDDYVGRRTMAAYADVAASATRDRHVARSEFVVRPRGADERTVACTVSAERNGAGAERLRWILQDVTAQRRAEDALRNERELLQAIFDTMPAMLAVYDPQTDAITLNRHVERVTGWTTEDARRTDIMELAFPDPEYRRGAIEHLRSSDPGFRDLDMATRAGGVVHASWASLGISDGRCVAIGVDITERVRSQEQIVRQQHLLAGINRVFQRALTCEDVPDLRRTCLQVALEVTGSGCGVFGEIDADGVLGDLTMLCDSQASRVQGGPLLLPRMVSGLAAAGLDADALTRGEGLCTNRPAEDLQGALPEGHPVLRSLLAVPLRRNDRTVGLVVVANREGGYGAAEREDLETLAPAVEEALFRRRTEEALRESEERYRTLFESMDEGFAVHEMVYDADGVPIDFCWLHVNPAFVRQTGLTDVEGRLALEVLPGIEEHWIQTYDRVVRTGRPARLESFAGALERLYSVYAYRYGQPEEHRFAVLFSDISERKRAETALEESRKRLAEELETAQRLQRVSSQLIQADDADALCALILDTAVDITGADYGSLRLLDPDSAGRDRLRLLQHRGFSERAVRVFQWIYPESSTSCGEVLRGARERIIVPDLERSETIAHGEHLPIYREEGVRALQTTPLVSRSGALLGAFSTYWREPCAPSERELRAIDVLARQAADLIERQQAEAGAQRALQHLSALYEGSQVLLGEPSAQDVLDRACQLAVDRFGLTMAWAGLLPEEPGQPLTPMAMAGHEAGWARRLAFSMSDENASYPVHRAIGARAPVVVDMAQDEGLHPEWRAEALDRGYRYMAVLPLIRGQGVVGVLSVKAGTRDALDAEQLQALQSLANLAAIGVQKARMYEELEHHAERLESEVRDRTESLRESVALFRAIFDGAASGIGLLDEEGRLFAWNPALERLLVGPDRALQDCVFRDLLVDDVERQAFREARRAMLLPGSSPVRIQARYHGPDGKTRWANLLLSVVRDSGDVVRFGLVVVDDITEMRAAQEALLHAEKLSATGRLAASFAHEIKNPLQAVIGCLGLAREAAAAGEDAEHYFQVAHDELLRANDLVSKLRNLNLRSDPDDRAPNQPAALIERVTALIRKQAQDQGVSVQVEVEDALPDIPVVPDAMQQVLLNLALNALDAMPQGGALCFGARSAPGQEVQLTVSDTGVGIAPEDLERIFEGFYSTKENGLGLGIFVSQSIVHQHDGRLEVESQVGEGTTFAIFLPA